MNHEIKQAATTRLKNLLNSTNIELSNTPESDYNKFSYLEHTKRDLEIMLFHPFPYSTEKFSPRESIRINELYKLNKTYYYLVEQGEIKANSDAAKEHRKKIKVLEHILFERKIKNENDFSETDSEIHIENIFAFLFFIVGFLILFAATVFAIYLILPKNLYI